VIVPFDKVILSCDDRSMFLDFWPVVCSAWYKFFPDVEVDLAFVTKRKESDPLISDMREYGSVTLYEMVDGIPQSNQGKIARAYHAGTQGGFVCSLHDMDTIPLQRNYLFDLLSLREKGNVCLIGSEVYNGTPDQGKTPLVPVTAEGEIFQNVYRTKDKSYGEFVRELVGMKVYDQKEDIMNQPFTAFSDESVLRVFLSEYKGPIQHLRRDELRGLSNRVHWIDRSNFKFDIDKLYSGFYTECNMIRPLKENMDTMKSVLDYVI